MLKLFKNFIECESGTTLIEYAFLAGMMSLALFGTIVSLGTSVTGYFSSLASTLQNVASGV